MRKANKQKIGSCKHLRYRNKTWTNSRPTFKVLAGNLLLQQQENAHYTVSATTIL